ncbi:MAG: co-chaperone GroES [Pseudobdellovibrio sp.]
MANKKKKVAKKPIKKTVKKPVKKPVKKVAKKASPKKAAKKITPKKKALKKVIAKKQVKKVVTKALVKKTIPVKAPVVKVDYSKAITPLADRLVVRVEVGERMTPGGLYLPDTASSIATGYLKAKVLAVGHGNKNKKGLVRPLDVQIGDFVLFSEHAGTKVKFNSEELQIIHESDVMGVVQN